jgi:hypothetical protein
MMEWFAANWMYVMAAFYVAEKVVALTPSKHDDIVLAIAKGVIKRLAGKKN